MPPAGNLRVLQAGYISKWGVKCLVAKLDLILLPTHGLLPSRLLCPWDSSGKNTGVGYHFLLQGIFLTQGSILPLLHWWRILYHWDTWEAPRGKQLPGKIQAEENFLRSMEGCKGCIEQTGTKLCHSQEGFTGIHSKLSQLKENNFILLLGGSTFSRRKISIMY